MSLTKITNRVIEPGTITANSLAEGVSLGGGDDVTIDQLIITDSNFANTEDIQIPSTGGFLKLYGTNFSANANVYFGTDLSLTYQVTSNVISSNEIRVTISAIEANTYNLFVIGSDGSVASKLNAVTSFLLQPTAGWFGGGAFYNPSSVDRITFADDTATATTRGKLSVGRFNLAAIGNDDYGWFGGGNPGPVSRVDRITFVDDTVTASVRGPLSVARGELTAVGNDNFGWFGGGGPGPGPRFSRVDRIDFAADTGTAAVRGPLTSEKTRISATGDNDYGWFGGGQTTVEISTVERITFASDTATATTRGPLSAIRYRAAATSGIA